MIQLASQLLTSSSSQLSRALSSSRTSTALGLDAINAFASLQKKLANHTEHQPLEIDVLVELADALATARVAAWQAGSAAVDIRKAIGGPASPANRYLWSKQSTSTTLIDVEEKLRQLSNQATASAQTSSAHTEEMTTIASGILSILDVACQNTMVANEAAIAAELLHIQATKFVHMIEGSGLLPTSNSN